MQTKTIDGIEFTHCDITNNWSGRIGDNVHIEVTTTGFEHVTTGWKWIIQIDSQESGFCTHGKKINYPDAFSAIYGAIIWVKNHNFLTERPPLNIIESELFLATYFAYQYNPSFSFQKLRAIKIRLEELLVNIPVEITQKSFSVVVKAHPELYRWNNNEIEACADASIFMRYIDNYKPMMYSRERWKIERALTKMVLEGKQ
jgi:hypothetical protein